MTTSPPLLGGTAVASGPVTAAAAFDAEAPTLGVGMPEETRWPSSKRTAAWRACARFERTRCDTTLCCDLLGPFLSHLRQHAAHGGWLLEPGNLFRQRHRRPRRAISGEIPAARHVHAMRRARVPEGYLRTRASDARSVLPRTTPSPSLAQRGKSQEKALQGRKHPARVGGGPRGHSPLSRGRRAAVGPGLDILDRPHQ